MSTWPSSCPPEPRAGWRSAARHASSWMPPRSGHGCGPVYLRGGHPATVPGGCTCRTPTDLSIVLVGAAVIREREHGTLEHLLVMPLTATEIMLSKVWANGAAVLLAASVSLYAVVQWWLGVPVAGSVGLFLAGAALYLFSTTALGILLATLARSMPQFGLLAIPVFVVMILLSGATTPMQAMPELLQHLMQALPAPHFVRFAQAVLYRGAGPAIVWPDLAAIAGLGAVFFAAALHGERIAAGITLPVTRMPLIAPPFASGSEPGTAAAHDPS
ncbi:MAG: ABC transporter permease [Arhodomonas sp.]|nr:ABC transporter permease [Arhodomonas sp.]